MRPRGGGGSKDGTGSRQPGNPRLETCDPAKEREVGEGWQPGNPRLETCDPAKEGEVGEGCPAGIELGTSGVGGH